MKFDKYRKNGAYHYEWYDDPNYAWYKECVDRVVDFCKGSTLDVGGGDGVVASKIIENGYIAIVADKDEQARLLCEKKDIAFNLIDIDKFGFKKDLMQPEYMACLNTIEHLEKPENLKRIIRDNVTKGAIIITDKKTDRKGRYHEKEYSIEELVEVFKEFNLKPFEINSTEFSKPIIFIGVEITK